MLDYTLIGSWFWIIRFDQLFLSLYLQNSFRSRLIIQKQFQLGLMEQGLKESVKICHIQ